MMKILKLLPSSVRILSTVFVSYFRFRFTFQFTASVFSEKAKECENEDWPPEDEDEVEKERSEERKRAEDWKKTVGGSRGKNYYCYYFS